MIHGMRVLAGAIMGLMLAGAALPADYDTPEQLLNAIYKPYLENGDFSETENFYSNGMVKLMIEATAREQDEDDGPILDFDPFIDAQDFEIKNLVISQPLIEGTKAQVDVSFDNFGEPRQLHYDLVFEDNFGWRVDDISSKTPDYEWRLSEILAADPLLN